MDGIPHSVDTGSCCIPGFARGGGAIPVPRAGAGFSWTGSHPSRPSRPYGIMPASPASWRAGRPFPSRKRARDSHGRDGSPRQAAGTVMEEGNPSRPYGIMPRPRLLGGREGHSRAESGRGILMDGMDRPGVEPGLSGTGWIAPAEPPGLSWRKTVLHVHTESCGVPGFLRGGGAIPGLKAGAGFSWTAWIAPADRRGCHGGRPSIPSIPSMTDCA